MANVQHPGYAPLSVLGGGFVEYKRVRVITNNTTAIALNDAVINVAGGDWTVAATTTIGIGSVACGASYLDANAQRVSAKHLPAATLYTSTGVDPANASYISIVADDVNTVFRASVDEAIALTDLGINYKMVLGANTNGISGHELDATSRDTTATFAWRVTDFIFGGDNDVDAADAHVKCRINAGSMGPALEPGGSLGT